MRSREVVIVAVRTPAGRSPAEEGCCKGLATGARLMTTLLHQLKRTDGLRRF